MKSLSALTTTATAQTWAQPRYLAQIDFTVPSALTLRVSDQHVPSSSGGGQEWLPLVADWGTLEEALNAIDLDGRPNTGTVTFFNTKSISGKSKFSDLVRSPLNQSGTYEFTFAKVTVYQRLFLGSASADNVQVGIFYIQEITEVTAERMTVRLTDVTGAIEDKITLYVANPTDLASIDSGAIGQVIPVPFGTLTEAAATQIVGIWGVAGVTTTLNGALTSAATTITVQTAASFPATGTVMIDAEHVSYTGKTSTTLTGCTRGVNSTTAVAHNDKVRVYEVRSGSKAYRAIVGENKGNYLIKSISNIKVNGIAAKTSPGTTLAETALVSGRSFATIDFTPSGVKAFHADPATSVEVSGSGPSYSADWIGAQQDHLAGTLSLTAITASEITPGRVTRTIVGRYTASSTLTNTQIYLLINGGLSGGKQILRNTAVAAGTWYTFTATYDSDESLADHTLYGYGGSTGNNTVQIIVDSYTATVSPKHVVSTDTSTAALVIGQVTCDVQGLQDDGSGTITGVASTLLELPADIVKCIHLACFPGVASSDFGSTFTATRAAQIVAGYKWAFFLGAGLRNTIATPSGPVVRAGSPLPYSALRLKLGEQGRAALYVEAGLIEYRWLKELPNPDLTFDYRKDVDATGAMPISKTEASQIRNDLWVSSAWSYTVGAYQRVTHVQDLTYHTDPIAYALALDLVQDATTAADLAQFWLRRWYRQRLIAPITVVWNAFAADKFDTLSITNHPVLTAHGDTSLRWEVKGKRYRPADARIDLTLLEISPTDFGAILTATANVPLIVAPSDWSLEDDDHVDTTPEPVGEMYQA